MAEHVPFGELKRGGGGGGFVSIRKLNTKTKLPASYCKSPRMEKKVYKFPSETKTQEGGEEGTASEGAEQCFCCSVFKSILLGQLTIKIN